MVIECIENGLFVILLAWRQRVRVSSNYFDFTKINFKSDCNLNWTHCREWNQILFLSHPHWVWNKLGIALAHRGT